ncbi:MAG: AAA family ATPase, partial [Pseudomonadota bacterium]
MLRGLTVQDMLIIDQLDLEFQPGLNVLTGETGAGKSILLDSLGFVLGWRGRAELVRQGADKGEVTACFDLHPHHPARAILQDAGFEPDDDVILRRVNAKDGRKTAYINDRRVSGQLLRSVGDCLIELHGQHDDRGLLNPNGHRDVLDAYAQNVDLRDSARAAWRSWGQAQKALTAKEDALKAVAEEEDFLRHAVRELADLDPQPDEENHLDARRRHMQAAERVRADVARAHAALGNDGAESRLADALRWVDGVAAQMDGGLDTALGALGDAMSALGDAQAQIETFLSSLDFDPQDLEHTEERLFALRAQARKHGCAVNDLPALLQGLQEKLDALDHGATGLAHLQAAAQAAQM